MRPLLPVATNCEPVQNTPENVELDGEATSAQITPSSDTEMHEPTSENPTFTIRVGDAASAP
jgi:hypothetical protein